MRTLFMNLPSMICAAAAAYLCYFDKDGWGWFLFVAIFVSVWESKSSK